MYAYVSVARVRSPVAISSPAAVKQSQILIIWVQCFWSFSFPHANAQSGGKQAPILSASTQQLFQNCLFCPLAVHQQTGHAIVTVHVQLPVSQGKQVFT